MTNAETVDLADKLGIPVKSHSSSMNEPYADMVRRRAERDGLTRDEQPAEPEAEKKPRKKKAPLTHEQRMERWKARQEQGPPWWRALPGESEEDRRHRVAMKDCRRGMRLLVELFLRRELLRIQLECGTGPIPKPPPFIAFWLAHDFTYDFAKVAYSEAILKRPRVPLTEIEVDESPFQAGVL